MVLVFQQRNIAHLSQVNCQIPFFYRFRISVIVALETTDPISNGGLQPIILPPRSDQFLTQYLQALFYVRHINKEQAYSIL